MNYECEMCGQRATNNVEWKKNGIVEKHFYCNSCYLEINPSETLAKGAEWYSEINEVMGQEFEDNGLDENGVPYDCNPDENECECPECRGAIPQFPEFPSFLGDLGGLIACQIYGLERVTQSSNKKANKISQKKAIPLIYCPTCGLSLEDVTKTQRAGCQKCYQVFDGVLMQKHRSFSDGKHYGGKNYKSKLFLSDIDYMQNELNVAVKNQDFERAAYLRDKLQKKASVENE